MGGGGGECRREPPPRPPPTPNAPEQLAHRALQLVDRLVGGRAQLEGAVVQPRVLRHRRQLLACLLVGGWWVGGWRGWRVFSDERLRAQERAASASASGCRAQGARAAPLPSHHHKQKQNCKAPGCPRTALRGRPDLLLAARRVRQLERQRRGARYHADARRLQLHVALGAGLHGGGGQRDDALDVDDRLAGDLCVGFGGLGG